MKKSLAGLLIDKSGVGTSTILGVLVEVVLDTAAGSSFFDPTETLAEDADFMGAVGFANPCVFAKAVTGFLGADFDFDATLTEAVEDFLDPLLLIAT